VLAKDLDIRFGAVVKEIDYISDNEVKILTSDGLVYTANKVIVTLPHAILKNNDVIFNPKLPEPLIKSINALGVAKMDKLIIWFEEAFWPKEVDWFNCVNECPGDWAQTLNIYKYLDKPILLMFNADPNSDKFMTMND